VTISSPAIDPATSTLPVMNQLIAKVSSVPNVRQLTALSTDLACVSAPLNRATGCDSLIADRGKPITPPNAALLMSQLSNGQRQRMGAFLSRSPQNYLI
jgi:hypothetical protein